MATTQFAMVEELASLIKDSLYNKHLVLSTEEALVNFLQDDTSVDGILELQPVSSYQRLLLHRLADIYGFAHESIGEGDDRHLVLMRCPETAIPPVLVSDILWQCDGNDAEASSHPVLRRDDPDLVGDVSVKDTKLMPSLSISTSFEEREAAYLAARERIFALHDGLERDPAVSKSRKVPAVARRMIAHALGQKMPSPMEAPSPVKSEENEKLKEPNMDRSNGHDIQPDRLYIKEANTVACSNLSLVNEKSCNKLSNRNSPAANGRGIGTEDLQKEHIGAAKRIFAQALGRPSGRGINDGTKPK